MSTSTTELTGSCLCGSVKFKVAGEVAAMYHCHCQRCRKANGTGHASNLRVKSSSILWLAGEKRIASYKVPDAERFRNDFCTNCGSPLPRAFAGFDFIIVPAGSLDCDIPDVAVSRIFNNSRAAWSCQDQLPTYDEYPPNR